MENELMDTILLDYKDPVFDSFCEGIVGSDSKDLAVQLYFRVRDAFLYDPYHLDLRPSGLKASKVIKTQKRAWCVEKSIVLAACARKFGIPSRLGYAIVTNHIGVDKLTHYLRRPEIVIHGYVELYLEGKWVKCTPAFDSKICRLSRVSPLDWNGVDDSMFQEFDGGRQFMEYLHFYGTFADVPVELMNAEMKKYYPHLFEEEYDSKEFSFYHM
jgi:transglutaminase-like putative cysteine protease